MAGSRVIPEPIRIDCRDGDRPVLVAARGEDRFRITVAQAADYCRVRGEYARFSEQLRLLFTKLGTWLCERRGDWRRAFVTVKEGGFLLLIVRSSVRYDPELESTLTRLDIALARDEDLDALRVQVLALPNVSDDTALSFLDESCVWEFECAESAGSSGSGGT